MPYPNIGSYDRQASARAAQGANEIRRRKALQDLGTSVKFKRLCVRTSGNRVSSVALFGRYLGPLAGSAAGVMNVKPAFIGSQIGSILTGIPPRVGTIFITFANGEIYETSLLQSSQRQMRDLEMEIIRYNTLAIMAEEAYDNGSTVTESEPVTPAPQSQARNELQGRIDRGEFTPEWRAAHSKLQQRIDRGDFRK